MDVTVVDAPDRKQFEGRLPDGTVAGLAAYELREGAILFTHTEVADEFEGQGIAGQIVRFALDAARERGLRVVALCPYVRAYLRKHRDEYADLVGQA
jgi:predicted GNAT family acetyltransferase